jgi:hypothetical protein
MKKVMNYLMLSCEKAAGLIDKKLISRLTWKEDIQLSMHTKMCDACSNYQKQSKIIDTAMESQIRSTDEAAISLLENKELKETIIHSLGH